MLRPKLNRIWAGASASTRRDPGDAKYIQGWISEIPTYQVLNYLQFKVDTTILAIAERGIPEWGTDVQYGLGSVVWDESTKKIYVSTVGSPDRNTVPSANTTQWSESSIQVPRASYDAINASITAHVADVTGNPHRLTAGRLNAYNKAEIDALVAQYRALVQSHASDKNNPHNVTAAQAGAVPITGGTYTGDVTFNGGLYFDSGKVNQISKTNGLYLQMGTFVLGLNASGVAVAGTTTSQSPLVTEQTFPDLKAQQEPNYAAPEPTFQMSLISSIHLARGKGISDADWPPTFSPNVGAMILVPDIQKTLYCDGVAKPVTNPQFTIAIDVRSDAPVNADTASHIVAAIESVGSMALTGDGRVQCGLAGGSAVTVTVGQLQVWSRLVMVVNSSNIKFYLNGVLAGETNGGVQGTTGTGNAYLRATGRGNALQRLFYVRNYRIWQSDALTAAQVSTL